MTTRRIIAEIIFLIGLLWSTAGLFFLLWYAFSGGGKSSPELGPLGGLLIFAVIATPGILLLACGILAKRQPSQPHRRPAARRGFPILGGILGTITGAVLGWIGSIVLSLNLRLQHAAMNEWVGFVVATSALIGLFLGLYLSRRPQS